MKLIAISFVALVLLVTSGVTYMAWCTGPYDPLAIGNFVVLSLTLIVLVWYAYDTNSMAKVTRERWAREGVLSTIYSMELIGVKGDMGRTLFRLHNGSPLLVRAKVAFNFRVYDVHVSAGPLYDGVDVWLVFPQQLSQGWFEIEDLLQKRGKTVAAMIGESTAANRREQLKMLLQLEFWDELGVRRKLPARSHYFDFERWAWIPELAERDAA